MFTFNAFNNPEPLRMYLCRPGDEIICELNGIRDESSRLKIVANDQFTLTFEYLRYITDDDGNLIESDGYHLLGANMYILVEKVGRFIMQQPIVHVDEDDAEYKSISSYSRDSELENKDISGYKINTGHPDSLEMIVAYEDGETESLLNDYTGLPYDYINFYDTRADQLRDFLENSGCPNDGTLYDVEMMDKIKTMLEIVPRLKSKVIKTTDSEGNVSQSVEEYIKITMDDKENYISVTLYGFMDRVAALIPFYEKYRSQLSLLDLALENSKCGWTVGYVDPVLVNKRFQFDIESQNIYSFLRETISQKARCIIDFDIMNMKINVYAIENYGEDTGISITRQNLQNSIEVSCDENSIVTRYRVCGDDDFGVNYVNFGSDKIDDISYFLNARDVNGERIYVSDGLANKYMQYAKDREAARTIYTNYTLEYNLAVENLTELQYRVPNPYMSEDWSQYTKEELNDLRDTYYRLDADLRTMYKTDYRGKYCPGVGNYVNSDDSINEEAMKTTEYWYDYEAYKTIIAQIEETLKRWPIYEDTNKDIMNGWKTEWSLYGTIELQAKIDTYMNSLKMGQESDAVEFDRSMRPMPWSELSEAVKKVYNGATGEAKYNLNYEEFKRQYDEMVSAQAYMDNTLKPQEKALSDAVDKAAKKRADLVALVSLEGYDRIALSALIELEYLPDIGSNSFTVDEVKIINLLYIDADYENSNFFTTSIDDAASTIQKQHEFLDDSREQLSIDSQPQLYFSSTLNNLLALPEFIAYVTKFAVGNYMVLQYFDDYYVKLRMVSFSINPRMPTEELEVEFSNFIKSRSKYDDFSFLLNNPGGTGGASASGGGGAGGDGTYGDGLDVTLSNLLLKKMLSTEMFGTAVTNVILDTMKLNSITARSATFEQLAVGDVFISGNCIKTGYIVSTNYWYSGFNPDYPRYTLDNSIGSIINMEDGSFSLAGGLLRGYESNEIFDENYQLVVKGRVTAVYLDASEEGNIAGWKINRDGLSHDNDRCKVLFSNSMNEANDIISVYDKNEGIYPFVVKGDGHTSISYGSIGAFDITKKYDPVRDLRVGTLASSDRTGASWVSISYNQIEIFKNSIVDVAACKMNGDGVSVYGSSNIHSIVGPGTMSIGGGSSGRYLEIDVASTSQMLEMRTSGRAINIHELSGGTYQTEISAREIACPYLTARHGATIDGITLDSSTILTRSTADSRYAYSSHSHNGYASSSALSRLESRVTALENKA